MTASISPPIDGAAHTAPITVPERIPSPGRAAGDDAIVVGSGPNGLAAANVLADAGWRVLVLEGNDAPGGAVRSAEITAPGFCNDLFSSFYPLGAISPVWEQLDLEGHGLKWRHAPLVLANPTAEGPTAVLSRDIDETAACLDRFAPGDGDAWRLLHEEWRRIAEPLIGSLLGPFPPVKSGLQLATRLGPGGALEFVRLVVITLRRLTDERFKGEGARLLLAGNLLHTDFSPESAGGMIPTLMLAMVGQDYGWPVPEGGAQKLTDTLIRRLEQRGGRVECGQSVTEVVVRNGRAVGVRTAVGGEFDAARAVLADVSAPALYGRLLAPEHVPDKVRAAMERFHWDEPSVKVDWAVSSPIPWRDPVAGRAGTVHIGLSLDELTKTSSELNRGLIPEDPFMLVGQMTVADPGRSPAGTESAWAYCHVPRTTKGDAGPDGLTGRWDEREVEIFAARMEQRIEALAPGFRDRIVARHVYTPRSLEAVNPNLDCGAVGGGTAQLHQQLIFRPIPGNGRPDTPIKGLFLASASAHPGGGVHGANGNNAARAALWHDRFNRAGAAVRRVAIGGTTARR